MAVPAFIERVTHEDPDGSRRLSSHDLEGAIAAIHGGGVTIVEFKNAINATPDDETDIDNIIGLVTSEATLDKKNEVVFNIMGTIGLAHLGYFNAASARTRLGIAEP